MSEITAAVIGTVFIDCKGFARDAYIPTGRNLGTIQFVHGGVGRNVAENLARLGVPTRFVSSVDASGLGQEVIERLREAGADTQFIAAAAKEGMGMWLAVLDQTGDLAGSISQMPDLGTIERTMEEHGDHIVQSSSHIMLELDLNAELSAKTIALAKRHGKPVYGIPGNLDVVLSHPELLGDLSCFICNHIEAERLLGAPVHTLNDTEQREALMSYLHQTGLSSIVMTMGSEGSVYAEANGNYGKQPVFPVRVMDTCGAGDAFFSGTAMGLMRGLPLKDAVVCGTKVAGWTIESSENNCLELSRLMEEDSALRAMLAQR